MLCDILNICVLRESGNASHVYSACELVPNELAPSCFWRIYVKPWIDCVTEYGSTLLGSISMSLVGAENWSGLFV